MPAINVLLKISVRARTSILSSESFVTIETAPLPRTKEPSAKSITFEEVKEASDLPVAPTPARPQTDVLACASISLTNLASIAISPLCVVKLVPVPMITSLLAVLVIAVSDTGTPTTAPVLRTISSLTVTSVSAFKVILPLLVRLPVRATVVLSPKSRRFVCACVERESPTVTEIPPPPANSKFSSNPDFARLFSAVAVKSLAAIEAKLPNLISVSDAPVLRNLAPVAPATATAPASSEPS